MCVCFAKCTAVRTMRNCVRSLPRKPIRAVLGKPFDTFWSWLTRRRDPPDVKPIRYYSSTLPVALPPHLFRCCWLMHLPRKSRVPYYHPFVGMTRAHAASDDRSCTTRRDATRDLSVVHQQSKDSSPQELTTCRPSFETRKFGQRNRRWLGLLPSAPTFPVVARAWRLSEAFKVDLIGVDNKFRSMTTQLC